MNSQYFSRIYFSRYFYSSFKSTLKARIKITRKDDLYFYSDPYYFNIKKKNFSIKNFDSVYNASARSYYFPLYFSLPLSSNKYDLAWQKITVDSDYFIKFFSLIIRLKLFNFSAINFIKIYFNFFFRSKKLWSLLPNCVNTYVIVNLLSQIPQD
jgi:hypothetical protein